MENTLFYLLLSWLAYFALHSLLALPAVQSMWPASEKSYRRFYVVVAILTLALPFYFVVFHPGERVAATNNISRFFGLALATYGFLVLRIAFREIKLSSFLGFGEEENKPRLVTTGIFGKIRHPINAGTLLLITGFAIYSLSMASLLTAICWWLYILIAMPWEEKKLHDTFGEAYKKYCEQVPRLLPKRLW